MAILTKLGLKSISELSDEELRSLVNSDRQARTMTRVAGRIKKIQKDAKTPKTSRPLPTLESIGLDPNLIAKLRAGGKTDNEIIIALKSKGII